jgi:hypothetical protein
VIEEARRLWFWQGAAAVSLILCVFCNILLWYAYRRYKKLKALYP